MRDRFEGGCGVCGDHARSYAAREGEFVRERCRSGAWRVATLVPTGRRGTGVRGAAADYRLSEYRHDSARQGSNHAKRRTTFHVLLFFADGQHAWRRGSKGADPPGRELCTRFRLYTFTDF